MVDMIEEKHNNPHLSFSGQHSMANVLQKFLMSATTELCNGWFDRIVVVKVNPCFTHNEQNGAIF